MSDRYCGYIVFEVSERTMNSPLIQAEMQGWEIDSIISIGMAAAFFLPTVLPFPWIQALVPYLDSILTIILSMIMLPMYNGIVI